MSLEFSVSALLPARPDVVYAAWLDSAQHAAMTGAPAEVSGDVGGQFQAWGGYIFGTNLELTVGERIVQAWRTAEFTDDEPESRLEITFEAEGEGARIRIVHSALPEHGMQYLQGWRDHYFTPMQTYFSP